MPFDEFTNASARREARTAVSRPGRFEGERPITAVLHEISLNGFGNDLIADGAGDWSQTIMASADHFYRLNGDAQGFITSESVRKRPVRVVDTDGITQAFGCHADGGTFCYYCCPAGSGDRCSDAEHGAILFGHETDAPEHCETCDALIPVTLTSDGQLYVIEAVAADHGDASILTAWREHWPELFEDDEFNATMRRQATVLRGVFDSATPEHPLTLSPALFDRLRPEQRSSYRRG